MDEKLTLRDELTLLAKEMRVGLFNGGCLGVMALAFLGIYTTCAKAMRGCPRF